MIFKRLRPPRRPVWRRGFLSRNAWKVGLGFAAAILLISRGATQAPGLPQLGARVAAARSIPCGLLPAGTVIWTAGTYNLPINPGNDPFPDSQNPPCQDGVVVGPNTTLVLDAAAGPVHIFSSGSALNVAGGILKTANTNAGTSKDPAVTFEAAADVASWDGINITASGTSKGNASLSHIRIEGALRSIQISSGATSSPADTHYGLTVSDSAIGFSYFDGIDATDTPISVTSTSKGITGTINNIGSIGINATFGSSAPTIPADALHIDGMTFGSSAPFGVNACPSNQPCYIGNQAILGTFSPNATQPVYVNNSNFYRAGTYGVQLDSVNRPVLTGNTFVCNGLGAPTTGATCTGSGPIYSAVYLNEATADLAQGQPPTTGQITGNHGYGNGLDAIAFNGAVVSQTLTWQNATNATSDATNNHWLGYLLTGDLNLANGTLVVPDGSVVKSLTGTINLTHSTLDAHGSNLKTFTSLRDPIGIASCPSVFAPSCGPAVLPAGEWGGINLAGGSNASINNANISYATTGVRIANGATSTIGATTYGLTVSNSTIGPTFSDGVFASGTPISVTNTTFSCPGGQCSGPNNGDHGISADFTGSGPLAGGLQLLGNKLLKGSVNEAIKGTGLAGQTVDIENNNIGHAGASGIQLVGADHLILKSNAVSDSGTGSPSNPAIYLNGVANADFTDGTGAITGNTGARNGLDAIAFHGDTKTTQPLVWKTVANSTSSGPLGYLVDGPLTVNGGLSLKLNDYVPSLGSITVTGGPLTATGAVVTSLRNFTVNIPTCGSVFDQKVSGSCPQPAPGDWGGLTLDSRYANSLSTASEIRYATTGITMAKPGIASPLTLSTSNIRNTSGDGIATQSSLAVSGGSFTNIGGRAVVVDFRGVAAGASLSITGASIIGTRGEGIFATGLTGQAALIDSVSVDHAGATGINLNGNTGGIDQLTLTGNAVTNTVGGYPAIYLNNINQSFTNITGNKGAGNGLDALVFHGTVSDNLTWLTAKKTGSVQPLGYLLDGDLNLAKTLEVKAGGIVKTDGALNVGHLKADDTANAGQKIFTSLADDTAGVPACQSVLLSGCTGPASGDWAGINLGSDGALVNGAIRYAANGLNISSKVAGTFGSSSFGLVVSRSRIDTIKGDAIITIGTPVSVSDSSITNAVHGINADFTSSGNHGALRLTGNRFANTGAEAVYGQALGGHPVWLADNRVQGAPTYGLRLAGADQLVLRNNNVSGSAAKYPAIFLSGVTADFSRDVRGNVGSANGLDAIVLDGTAIGDLNWISPSNKATTHALGYLLDGGLTLNGGTLTARTGDTVKALGGPIKINGGGLNATGTTFTSLKDGTGTAVSCPSVFVATCSPSAADWGGLDITADKAGNQGTAAITGGQINYAETAVSADSGPIAGLIPRITVSGVSISNTQKDGINSFDTPITVKDTTITTAGSHGIIASFFSPSNCPSGPCERLTVDNVDITGTGKDGIVANGLANQPVTITNTTVTNAGTYGIRLVGADKLSMTSNTITGSGNANPKYPAIYLSGVTGDFQGAINGNTGSGNGLNALVFHGVAKNGLNWITPTLSGTLGYMLDGALTVNGTFTSSGVVKVLSGAIKVNGMLTSTNTAFTSMRESSAPSACGSVFLPNGCPSSVSAQDYWDGINLDPTSPSTFTGGSISDAATGLSISRGEIDMTGATLTNNSGYALQTTGTGSAVITCTGIHGNGGGLLSEGASTTSIDNSDLYGNSSAGQDLMAAVPTSASRVWWGQTPPAPTQYTPVFTAVDKPLPQQPPTVKAAGLSSVVFGSDDTNDVTGNFGKGTLTVTLTFDRSMNLNDPLTVNFSSTFDGLPHAVVGDWTHTDKVTWVGTAPIDGTDVTGHTSLNSLSVLSGTSCMRDGTNQMNTETAPFNLDFSTALVDDTAGANHVGATSATVNGLVDAQGWSKPSTNPGTETYAFVEAAALGTVLPDPATVIAGVTSPSTLLGYTAIGHGTTPLAVSQTITGLLPGTAYHYAVVAVDLNGIAVGADRQFTTAGPVDHYSVSSSSSSVTAGDTYAFAVTAEDSANMTVDDYTGTVHFSLQQADTNASLPVDYTFKGYSTATPTIAGDDGTHGFSATLKKATNQEILANDTATTIGGSLAVTVNPAGLDHLGLAPSTASVSAGDDQSYTAEGFDPFENSLGDVTSATTFAITPDGTCVGASCSATLAGSHTVTGTDTTKTGSATLTVTPASLDHLVLSPATATMTAGSSQVYTAEGFDQYANSRGDVTSSTTFTIAPDGSCSGASCTATVVGTHTVTGTDGSATGTATLTVTAAPLDHLVLAPATATMGAGGSQTYTAEGFDQYGNDLGDRTALTTFTLDDATGGCTLASCTETKAGSHTVTGTDGGKTGTAALTVTAGPLDHLGLNPASGSIVTGGTETYTAEGFDQYGNDLGDKTTATTFTIAPDGSCTGADCTASVVGPHMVTGTDGAASGTATLTVNAVAAPIVTGINPTTGPDAGGTTVTITGTDLGLASDVKFGTSSVAIISNSSTQIVVKSPTHSAGAFDVTVTTAGGTSATSSADQFTFVSYAETVLADSPATYWRLGESSGSTSSDSSGASHDGTYATGVMLSVTGALTGDGNTAVALDGIAGSIQDTSGAGAPTGSADRSLEIWFKTTTTTSQPIFSYGAGSLSQFSVNLSGSHVLVNDGAETLDFTAGGSLADGAWHHLVVTYDSTTGVMVYLDGSAVGTAQATSGSLATVLDSSGFEVGTDGTGFFNGSLDEAAIYGSALTSGEVAKHYHAGVGD